ncbi:MAG TPA: DUF4139 domain-containing protein, partial [Polyangiaceae bacterium]|nr:DUF4139 domain-containing protein [Polyangiaceae bacterium]
GFGVTIVGGAVVAALALFPFRVTVRESTSIASAGLSQSEHTRAARDRVLAFEDELEEFAEDGDVSMAPSVRARMRELDRAVDEMPGVDDGGEPLSYEAPAPVTLASDGRPFRVEIGRAALRAKVERVALPERAQVAHLRATATLVRGGPLLAGPVRVARGAGLVGRTSIAFVGRGEPFELGFGADDAVRVRRRVEEVRDTVSLIGTQVLKRTVKVFLSNLADGPRTVEVSERFPVSELDEVEVSVQASEGVKLDHREGFARKTVELAPHGVAELSLAYELRAAAKVRLSF